MSPALEDRTKAAYQQCLDWMYDQKGKIESARYGRNKQSVLQALDEQNKKAKQIADFERDVNRVKLMIRNDEDRKQLDENYATLKEASQKKISCLQTMLGITSLEEVCNDTSHQFDSKAVDLAAPNLDQNLAKGGQTNIMGFLAPSAQDCVFAASDNWEWIVKLVDCVKIHLKNASGYHQFFHEVDESSEWLKEDLKRLHESFELHPLTGEYHDAQRLLQELTDLNVCLRQWEARADNLWKKSNDVIPVHLRTRGINNPTPARALCGYETDKVSIHEGEDLLVLDNSDKESWRVKTARGQEVEIPAVCVLIPGPYGEAVEAAVKMRLQLLASWTDAIKKMGQRLICFMLMVFKPDYRVDEIEALKGVRLKDKSELMRVLDKIENTLKTHWSDHEGFVNMQERILMLRMILEQTGQEGLQDENMYKSLIVQITTLEDLVDKYKDLWKQWELYKVALEASRSPDLMLIADKWEQLQYVTREYFSKFWKTQLPMGEVEKSMQHLRTLAGDVTNLQHDEPDQTMSEEGLEETVVKETILQRAEAVPVNGARQDRKVRGFSETETFEEGMVEERISESTVGYETSAAIGRHVSGGDFGVATETKTAETEQIDSAEVEEKKTFIIKSVVDPRDEEGKEISLQDAIMFGIINPREGLYTNTVTGETMPIPAAMAQGVIKVEFTSTRRGLEKRSTIGIITVKTIKEKPRSYTIQRVKDTLREEFLTPYQAAQRHILDEKHGIFVSRKSGREMLLAEAIEKNFVEVMYSGPEQEPDVVSQAYAVRAVVDRRAKRTITFGDALRRGIIDKETGAYKDTKTGESMYVGDAIMRGYLKARPVDDPTSLNIDPENKMLIDKTETIKKKVLRPLGVISAFKRAGRLSSGGGKTKP